MKAPLLAILMAILTTQATAATVVPAPAAAPALAPAPVPAAMPTATAAKPTATAPAAMPTAAAPTAMPTAAPAESAAAIDFDFNEMEYTPHQTTFQLFAPATAKSVKVRIYNKGIGGKPVKTVAMKRSTAASAGLATGSQSGSTAATVGHAAGSQSGSTAATVGHAAGSQSGSTAATVGHAAALPQPAALWTATIRGDLMNKFYTFDTGHGETPGVFARAVGVNGLRGAIIDEEKTFPDDWCCDQHPVIKSPADLVVYELHHRDFSVARPGAKYPGKFLALTEPWAIDHLKELGVNAVHILPSYDFGSIDETAIPPLPSLSPSVSSPSQSSSSPSASPSQSSSSPSASPSSSASSSVGCAAALPQPQYNWGYDPQNYNVPEGSYSTDPYDPVCRIREFKQMVQALHKAGIAVILDVVYNHTYDIDHSNFQRTFPDYYYRTHPQPLPKGGEPRKNSNDAGSPSAPSSSGSLYSGAAAVYSNGSGCGNETASERAMMRRFMIESVKYWYNEYRVDGFRFDLMGCHDIETMNLIREELNKLDPSIFIYGEGWSAGPCALPNEQLGMKANIQKMPSIAAFSDELRDALRGPFSDDAKPGWLGLASQASTDSTAATGEMASLEESIKFGIVGAIAHPQVDMTKVNYSQQPWAAEPTQMMAYVSCHDDMCLTDRLRASIPGLAVVSGLSSSPAASGLPSSPAASGLPVSSSLPAGSLYSGAAAVSEALIRLDLLAQTAVMTSQGVPFLLAGEELLRTKQGVHNSFESPDSINQIDWQNKERHPQVFKYYKDLIALRRHHPAFRLGDAHLVRKHLEFLEAPRGVVAFRLKDYAGRDDWRNIIVILNANPTEATVAIPKGMYTVVCKDGVIDEQSTSKVFGRRTTVSPQSALIMYQP